MKRITKICSICKGSGIVRFVGDMMLEDSRWCNCDVGQKLAQKVAEIVRRSQKQVRVA